MFKFLQFRRNTRSDIDRLLARTAYNRGRINTHSGLILDQMKPSIRAIEKTLQRHERLIQDAYDRLEGRE